LDGGSGNDSLDGGDGNDSLSGGDGNDSLSGAGGDDFLYGGSGDDTLNGGDGTDWTYYYNSPSAVTVNLATGTASGGDGNDTLMNIENVQGSRFDDTLTGDGNSNYLIGYGGNDTLNGGAGNDRLDDIDGNNLLSGGDGNDSLYGSGTLDGGAGDDSLNPLFSSTSDTLTGGTGGDVFNLGEYSADGAIDRITDFTVGEDVLNFNSLLKSLTGYSGGNPFTNGYLRFVQDGADTLFQVDQNGGGDSYATAVILSNVTASTLSTPPTFTGLNGNPTYTEDGAAVVLDSDVTVNYTLAGGSNTRLEIQRHGFHFDAGDCFVGTGTLSLTPVALGGYTASVLLDGAYVGYYDINNWGDLTINFSNGVTPAQVNGVLQQIAYYSASDAPPASVQLDWTFSDTVGGTATGSTVVNLIRTNDAPVFGMNDGMAVTDVVRHDGNSTSWGGDDQARALTLLNDGGVLVAGHGNWGPNGDFILVRYGADGRLDSAFGDGGSVGMDFEPNGYGSAYAVAAQNDGKFLVAGAYGLNYPNSGSGFAMARFNADGSLDSSFDGDGKAITPLGSGYNSYQTTGLAVQPDGKILVAGTHYDGNSNGADFAVVRYNTDGSLDTNFDSDGKAFADVYPGPYTYHEVAASIALQADGKVLVAGTSRNDASYSNDFALVRFNADGTLDTSFDGDGILTTDLGTYSTDSGKALAVQADGKILLAGISNNDFAVVRYNADGSLDTSFGTGGKVLTAIGASIDEAYSLAVQADGKILLAGRTYNGKDYDIALIRYNTNGSLDASFGSGGKVVTAIGKGDEAAYGVAVQADGKILVTGSAYLPYGNFGGAQHSNDFVVVRYNPDGSLDTSFDASHPVFSKGGPAVVLDSGATLRDAELEAANSYSGATLTLARHGGTNPDDEFSATGTLRFLDGKVSVSGRFGPDYFIDLGTYTQTGGTLTITFSSGGIIGTDDVQSVIQQIAYRNTSATPPSSITLDWTFNDHNTGTQGSGGALSATTSTVVLITDNQRPVFSGLDGTPDYHAKPVADAPVVLDGNATVADADLDAAGNYAGATLTLARHGGANPADEFSATGTLSLTGGVVSVGGTAVGSYANAAGTLAISFDANATPERVDGVLQQIAYRNTSPNPPATAQIDWTFSDGNSGIQGIGGPLSATGSTTVKIYDNPPAFTGLDGAPSFTENGTPVVLDADVTVSDLDLDAVGNYKGATLTLTRHGGGNYDDGFVGTGTLSLNYEVNVDGVWVGNTQTLNGSPVITFNENATPALVDKVLQQIGYSNGSSSPPASVQIDWTFNDGHNGLATGSTTVAITAVNDAPILRVIDGLVTTVFGGYYDQAENIALLTDGDIVVAGDAGYSPDFKLARYNADGSLDSSFGTGGKVVTDFGGYDQAHNAAALTNGKILVVGNSGGDFALARYNADGNLDATFGSGGKLVTDFGEYGEEAHSAVALADGKVLVAGSGGNGWNFALARYNADGSLDTPFDGDGKLTTAFNDDGAHSSTDGANSVTVLPDGRILAAGIIGHNFAVARYNADGSLDTTFDGDGKLTTDFGGNGDDYASAIAVLIGGDILVAGSAEDHDRSNFALARYHADGSLDTTFGAGGKVIVDFGGDDHAKSIKLLPDGDILLIGTSTTFGFGSDSGNPALARLNSDGTLDGAFGVGGQLTANFGAAYDYANAVTVLANGDILAAGTANNDFALARYHADGTLDGTFGAPLITASGLPVVLRPTASVYDAELATANNYSGSTLTLARHGGANAEDIFSGAGTLSFADGLVKLDGVAVGKYLPEVGTLTISFLSGTTQANINGVLSQIAYSNTAASLPASPVQIDWTFNDGNTAGGQGTGGALTATGSTTVRFNHAPTIAHPLADQAATGNSAFTFTVPADAFADPDAGDTLTYTASKADGSALPAWLSFNASTRAFNGTPTNADAGSLNVKVAARDGSGATVSDEFALTVTAGSTGGGGGGGTVPTPPPSPEDQVPSPSGGARGDGNGDGVADSQQDHVASLTVDSSIPQTGDKSYVTLSDSQGLPLNEVRALPAPTNAPTGVTFPLGQFSFRIDNAPTGGTVTMSVFVDGSIPVNGYWKLNQQTQQWENIATKIETVGNKTRIDFALKDGGPFDTDGAANGSIQDPGGPAIQANRAPTVAHALADQSAGKGQAFSFQVPADAFADADSGDVLSYTATLADGSALPAWLSFNAATRTFSGTPAQGDVGSLDVKVTATDPAKANVSDTFALTVANTNTPPTVAHALADQTASKSQAFSVQVPADAFTDADSGDALSYTATKADGSALPAWLSFDAATRTFSGTPTKGDLGALEVKVTATDSAQAAVSDTFTLTVQDHNTPPSVARPLADQAATEGQGFTFQVPADAFADADTDDTLSYAATLGNGAALPAWLAFDPATRTFSGTPHNADVGSLNIQVAAADPAKAVASDVFTLVVNNVNDAPTTANHAASLGQNAVHSFAVADFPFSDADAGDALQAVRIDSLPLEGQLRLNGQAVQAGQSIARADIDAGRLAYQAPATVQGDWSQSFGFHVGDGQAVSTNGGVFTLNLTPPSSAKLGTDSANRMNGTGKADLILGHGGNDVIDGKDGNDRLYGEAGQDNLKGGAGNDLLSGGSGDDKLYGQDGKDTLIGGTGNDLLDGGAGKDVYRYLASQFGLDDLAAGGHDTIKATKGDTIAFDASLWAHLTQNGTALDDLAGKGLLKQIDADTNIAYDGHSLMFDLNGDGLFQAGQDMSIDLMGVHKVGVDATGQFLVMS
jgi:uncharacterized delta-60 repeat protein